jgi:hypothetical protein
MIELITQQSRKSAFMTLSSGGAAITSKLMPDVYATLLAGIAGKCTSLFKGTDARRWSVAPASRHGWQLSRDVHVGNVARWKQCLPGEREIEEAAIVREELDVSAAEHVLENGRSELDLATTGNSDRLLDEAIEIIGRTRDVLTIALQYAMP